MPTGSDMASILAAQNAQAPKVAPFGAPSMQQGNLDAIAGGMTTGLHNPTNMIGGVPGSPGARVGPGNTALSPAQIAANGGSPWGPSNDLVPGHPGNTAVQAPVQAPQPGNPPQASYQPAPSSASNDALSALFNQSSGLDTTQLDATLKSIQDFSTRAAAGQASSTASQALGSGASGTPVAAMANDAVGAVLAQSGAQQNQTALDYLLGGRGQNMSGMTSVLQGALAGEGQGFNQQIASQQQQLNNLSAFGQHQNQVQANEQAMMDAGYQEFLRLQGANPAASNQLAQLMGNTPMSVQQQSAANLGPAGQLIGAGLGAAGGAAFDAMTAPAGTVQGQLSLPPPTMPTIGNGVGGPRF